MTEVTDEMVQVINYDYLINGMSARKAVRRILDLAAKQTEVVPTTQTNDQIAAVMLMKGNKGQVAEAVAYSRGMLTIADEVPVPNKDAAGNPIPHEVSPSYVEYVQQFGRGYRMPIRCVLCKQAPCQCPPYAPWVDDAPGEHSEVLAAIEAHNTGEEE